MEDRLTHMGPRNMHAIDGSAHWRHSANTMVTAVAMRAVAKVNIKQNQLQTDFRVETSSDDDAATFAGGDVRSLQRHQRK